MMARQNSVTHTHQYINPNAQAINCAAKVASTKFFITKPEEGGNMTFWIVTGIHKSLQSTYSMKSGLESYDKN